MEILNPFVKLSWVTKTPFEEFKDYYLSEGGDILFNFLGSNYSWAMVATPQYKDIMRRQEMELPGSDDDQMEYCMEHMHDIEEHIQKALEVSKTFGEFRDNLSSVGNSVARQELAKLEPAMLSGYLEQRT